MINNLDKPRIIKALANGFTPKLVANLFDYHIETVENFWIVYTNDQENLALKCLYDGKTDEETSEITKLTLTQISMLKRKIRNEKSIEEEDPK